MIDDIEKKINDMIKDLQDGLLPEVIAEWYDIVLEEARALAPNHLKDKINIRQNEILPMKFELDISKRAIPFLLTAIEENLGYMPYSTRLYFEKVREIILKRLDA